MSRIINSVLGKCSHIRLRREHETASWVRILQSDAEDGNYVVFFKVQPLEREEMYNSNCANKGEYLQMALVDVGCRIIVPGNSFGTGLVIRHEIEILCDDVSKSTRITDILNRPTTNGKIRGLYPSEFHSYEKRNITMQGIYEIMEVRKTEIHGEAVYRRMEDIVRDIQKRKRDKGTDDNGNNVIKESDLEVNNLFRTNLADPNATKNKTKPE